MQTLLSWCLIAFVVLLVWGAPKLRARHPIVWWLLIGYPRSVVRALVTWRRLSMLCDLAVARRPQLALLGGLMVKGRAVKLVPPRLGLPRRIRGGVGMTVSVRLHPGQTPDMVTGCADAIAHAWRMHSVRVTSPERGRALLTCLPLDPLAATEPAADLSGKPPSDPAELLRVRIGRCEDGAPWVVDLREVPHWLTVGATQSGKSTWMASLVCGLAPRPVALVGIDLKGGMELGLFAPRLSALATDLPGAARLLGALVDEAHERMARCKVHGVRSVWDLPEDVGPVPVVVLVDELAELFLVASRAEKDDSARAVTALVRLAQIGRALGIHLVIAGQRVGSDLGPGATALRAQLGGRVCHRVSDPGTAEMALGDLHPDAVDAAMAIAPTDAGVAVTVVGPAWLRARAAYTDPKTAAAVSADHAHITPAMPDLVSALSIPTDPRERKAP